MAKLIRGYTCGQVFVAPPAYLHFYLMKSKADVSLALMQNIHDVGIMSDLISDGAKEEVSGKVLDITRQHHIRTGRTEPYSQWQNRAEGEIRELKKAALRQQRSSGSPQKLWCYLMEYVAATRRLTAWNNPSFHGRTAAETIEGNTPDISEFAQFGWYEYVWYIDPVAAFPEMRRKLGRFIGVATDTGAAMTFSILPLSCKPIARSSVQALTDEEKTQPAIQLLMAAFDTSIRAKIGDQIAQADFDPTIADFAPEPYAFDIEDSDNDMQWDPVQLDHVRED